MDKAAIFAEILRRNALRREAGLPALDVTAEYYHAVAQAERAEFRAICDQHRDLWDEVLATATQELRAKRANPSFGYCMGSRIMIQEIARERFYAALERRGYKRPSGATRNAVGYGKGADLEPDRLSGDGTGTPTMNSPAGPGERANGARGQEEFREPMQQAPGPSQHAPLRAGPQAARFQRVAQFNKGRLSYGDKL